MKKLGLLFVVAFIASLSLDSCSIQKRYHRKGFTVNWNHTSIGGKKDKKMDNVEQTIMVIDDLLCEQLNLPLQKQITVKLCLVDFITKALTLMT